MEKAEQIGLGRVLVRRARRCWDLTAAVPQEHEAALWEQGERLIDAAALFGDEGAEQEVVQREARRAEMAQLDIPHHAFW